MMEKVVFAPMDKEQVFELLRFCTIALLNLIGALTMFCQ